MPRFGLDADSLNIGPGFLCRRLLSPKTCDEQERLINIKLTKCIAKADRRALLRRLRIHRDAAVVFVGARRNVPLLGVARWFIAAEKGVAQPFLEQQAMTLHFTTIPEGKE